MISPCKAEPDIWMRQSNRLREYIAVYVDDLVFVVRDPKKIIIFPDDNNKYKLKVIGSISYHLDCDFFRDDEDKLCMFPKIYIEQMTNGYQNMFDKKHHPNTSHHLKREIILSFTQQKL